MIIMIFKPIILLSIILIITLPLVEADVNAFSIVYKIPQNDINPPMTSISLIGTLGNAWYTSNVTTSLNATDNESGVNYTAYNINNGSWLNYISPFLVSIEGTNIVYYYSSDNAGNIEQIQSQAIKIDKIPPASITSLTAKSVGRNYVNWTWKDPTGSDTSGYAYVMVYINGIFNTNVSKDVQYYNATGLSRNKQQTISTHTVDNAGNINMAWTNNSVKTLK